jgi:hypothetical protein
MGTLMATGLIVGESLFGVLFAGIVAATGNDNPLAIVGDGFVSIAMALGAVIFATTLTLMYRHARQSSVA